MLPANMFGKVSANTFGCVTRSPCSRSSGMPVLPRALAGLAVRDVDLRVAIGIAVDEPLETEIDQRRRIDDEIAGSDTRHGRGRRRLGRKRHAAGGR